LFVPGEAKEILVEADHSTIEACKVRASPATRTPTTL
jgi:hypothetical protein